MAVLAVNAPAAFSGPLSSGIGHDPRVVGDAVTVLCQSRCEAFDDVGRDVVQDAQMQWHLYSAHR